MGISNDDALSGVELMGQGDHKPQREVCTGGFSTMDSLRDKHILLGSV